MHKLLLFCILTLYEKFNTVNEKKGNIGINIEINCTYVNLGPSLLFLCNLGSIHGYFIRFGGSLFVRCCFPTPSEARQVTVCALALL